MKSVSHIVSLMLLLFSFATPFLGYTQDMLQKLPLATLEQLLKARPQQDTISFRFKQYRIVVRLKSG